MLPEALQPVVRTVQRLVAAYREKEDLIAVGAYQQGSDPAVDLSIKMREPIADFLRQSPSDLSDWQTTTAALAELRRVIHAKEASS